MSEFKVIDLFAGAGGFGLGFKEASPKYKVILSLEVDKWAVETLEANNSHPVICQDIRSFKEKEQIVNACLEVPDVIIGGPPCQGFSYAGPIKDPKDPRNSLFRNFVDWVGALKPKVFVMENVRGILTGRNHNGEKVINIIKASFEEIGYSLNIWELNAANYGVPQNRERVFIVGNRYGKSIEKPAITHFLPDEKIKLNGKIKGLIPSITVEEAIGDLPFLRAGEGNEISEYVESPKSHYQNIIRGKTKLLANHVPMVHSKRVVERYSEILLGKNINNLSDELKVRKRNGNGEISKSEYNSNYRHLKPGMISFTIPASFYSNFIHPFQPRNITSREAARLQSFPDSYIFKGKRTQISAKLLKQLGKEDQNHLSQYNQIGNAVPPLLAKAVAQKILDFLEGN